MMDLMDLSNFFALKRKYPSSFLFFMLVKLLFVFVANVPF